MGRADEIARIDAAIAGAGRGQGRSSDSKPDPEMGSRGSSTRPPWAPSSAANGSSGRKHTSSGAPAVRDARGPRRVDPGCRGRGRGVRRCAHRIPRALVAELRTVLPSLHRFLADPERSITPRWSAGSGALAALFDALGTRNRPAVLLLDDCQWADDLSLGVVSRWSASSRDGSRFVTVVAAIRREEVDEDHPSRGWTRATTITLPPSISTRRETSSRRWGDGSRTRRTR